MLKNNRGITLVSLVITILVLAITGSIATYSGISALRYINFTNAKTQMETMQSKVNGWYQEVKNNPETEISSYGKPLNEADAEKVSTTLGPISKDGYKYFSSDYIKNTLKIDGISYDFLININTASVFLYGGITYEGTKYCSAKDFGINQVETEGISGKIGFDTTIKDSNIIVHNIKIQDNNHKDLDINKYDVQYKLGDNNYWTTAKSDLKKKYNNDDNAWYIPIKGTCNIKITANEIESEEQYITLENIKSANTTFKENATLIDDNGDKIVVPKNFKIASESPIKVTEGMIIEDNDKNQYVWIPVFERTDDRTWGANYNAVKTKTEYTAEYYTAIQTALKNYTNAYRSSSYTDVWYGDASYGQYGYYEESDTAKTNLKYYTNGNMTKPEYETLYNNMLESVYKNKGFYIGRYEMGIKVVTNINDAKTYSRIDASREYVSTATNANNQKPTIEGMTLPISKANAIPYNRITQSQAQMLAEKLGKEVDYSNVRTSIMFGVQWDAVCVFVEKYDKNNTATTKSNWITNINECKKWGNHKDSTFNMKQGSFHSESANTNSVSWNNYSNKTTAGEWLCTTGASDQNSSLNIYDLGGNLFEWTLERYNSSNQPCTHRGGSYSNNIPTNARYYVRQTIEGYYDMSSRAALYIK